jgi:hypothetical protein
MSLSRGNRTCAAGTRNGDDVGGHPNPPNSAGDRHAEPERAEYVDVEFVQTVKWDGDRLIEISAFWDAAPQARQIGVAQ